MPTEPSSLTDFTSSGNFSRLGALHHVADGEHRKVRHANAMVRQNLFRERLIVCQQQPARIATGVRFAHQLQVADDVLIVHGHTVKLFEAG